MINLQYLYLDESDPSTRVFFQDQNSQILGFKFKKNDDMSTLKEHDLVFNPCVYFLFSEDSVYIGKSMNGINRIQDHVRSKEFWSTGLMFFTDNNNWTNTTIDYLEYAFINKFASLTDLDLTNKEIRSKEPNVGMYEIASIKSAIEKINFYLNCHNISTSIEVIKTKNDGSIKYYYNASKNSKLYYDGDSFILSKGSRIVYPREGIKKHTHNGENQFLSLYNNVESLIRDGLVDSNLMLTDDLKFKSPSRAGMLCSGGPINGWTYFKGLEEIKG